MPAPPLPEKPGNRDNWVDKAGGLPPYIDRIARHVFEKNSGRGVGFAVASAVNRVKAWCKGSNTSSRGNTVSQNVSAATKAKACAAVAEWMAKRAKSKGKTLTEAGLLAAGEGELAPGLVAVVDRLGDAELSLEDEESLVELLGNRQRIVEGLWDVVERGVVDTTVSRAATHLLEGSAEMRPWELEELRGALADEWELCAGLREAMGYARHPIRGEGGKFHGMHGVERAVRRRALIPGVVEAPPEEEETPEFDPSEEQVAELREAVATYEEQAHPRGGAGEWVAKGATGRAGSEPTPEQQPVRDTVTQLQQRLVELGFQVPQNGAFDGLTHEAVTAFQKKYGLPENGQLDPVTVEALRTPPAKSVDEAKQETQKKAAATRSASASAAQRDLDSLGYDLGSGVRAAVRQFQRDEGLKVTGKLDEQTAARVEASRTAARDTAKATGSLSLDEQGGKSEGSISSAPQSRRVKTRPRKQRAVAVQEADGGAVLTPYPGAGTPDASVPSVPGSRPEPGTRPPNLREAGEQEWERCGNCVHHDGKVTCQLYQYRATRGQVSDAYRTLTPDGERHRDRMVELSEAIEVARAAGDGDALVLLQSRHGAARARLVEAVGRAEGNA